MHRNGFANPTGPMRLRRLAGLMEGHYMGPGLKSNPPPLVNSGYGPNILALRQCVHMSQQNRAFGE